MADKATQGLTSRVLNDQHRPPVLAHEFHWPQRPSAIEVFPQRVFVCETTDARRRRVLSRGRSGHERISFALFAITQNPAEAPLPVLPQQLIPAVFRERFGRGWA